MSRDPSVFSRGLQEDPGRDSVMQHVQGRWRQLHSGFSNGVTALASGGANCDGVGTAAGGDGTIPMRVVCGEKRGERRRGEDSCDGESTG